MRVLLEYSEPGTVRELEYVVEQVVALASHAILLVNDLPH
jgi:transcriptional regulator of acetoin/glycerol metabolism